MEESSQRYVKLEQEYAFCAYCGAKHHISAHFCQDCGAKLPEYVYQPETAGTEQGKLEQSKSELAKSVQSSVKRGTELVKTMQETVKQELDPIKESVKQGLEPVKESVKRGLDPVKESAEQQAESGVGEPVQAIQEEKSRDGSSFGYALLGCLFPVVGLVLYLVWREELPMRARSAGKGALVGVVLYVIFCIVKVVLPVYFMRNVFSTPYY